MERQKQKSQTRIFSLLGLAYERLKEIQSKASVSGIIPFPHVFSKLCASFSLPKVDAWQLILTLKDIGLIEIVPFHGIRIVEKDF